MSRFNLFEGSRRIALILKGIWVIAVVVVSYTQSPFVTLTFFTMMPNDAFVRLPNEECEVGTDALDFLSREFAQGRAVSVQLCYKAARSDDSRLLVPFQVDAGRWLGNERYSTEVMNYTNARTRDFALNADDREAASRLWDEQRWQNIRNAFLFAIGGWVILSILQGLIGWIVRGFMGIPWGQDRRPAPTPMRQPEPAP